MKAKTQGKSQDRSLLIPVLIAAIIAAAVFGNIGYFVANIGQDDTAEILLQDEATNPVDK